MFFFLFLFSSGCLNKTHHPVETDNKALSDLIFSNAYMNRKIDIFEHDILGLSIYIDMDCFGSERKFTDSLIVCNSKQLNNIFLNIKKKSDISIILLRLTASNQSGCRKAWWSYY